MAHRDFPYGAPKEASPSPSPPTSLHRIVLRIGYHKIPGFEDPLEKLSGVGNQHLEQLARQEVLPEMREVLPTEYVDPTIFLQCLERDGWHVCEAFRGMVHAEEVRWLVLEWGRPGEGRHTSHQRVRDVLHWNRVQMQLGRFLTSAVWRVEAKRNDGTLVVLFDEPYPVGDPPVMRPKFHLRFEGGQCVLTNPWGR